MKMSSISFKCYENLWSMNIPFESITIKVQLLRLGAPTFCLFISFGWILYIGWIVLWVNNMTWHPILLIPNSILDTIKSIYWTILSVNKFKYLSIVKVSCIKIGQIMYLPIIPVPKNNFLRKLRCASIIETGLCLVQ